MKQIEITYDVYVTNESGQDEKGEACCVQLIDADFATRLSDGRMCNLGYRYLERLLADLETLRGRYYITGSIKAINIKE